MNVPRAIIAAILIAAAAAATAQPQLAPADLLARAEALVDEANALAPADIAAARARELEAAALYRALIADHAIDTAAIHRNLGVLELRLGNLGRAVASLKRAAARDPADPRVRDSLAAARARVRTAVDPGVRHRTLDALLFWRDAVPRPAILAAALAAWAAAWLALAARAAAPRRPIPAAIPAAFFALAALAGGSLALERYLLTARREAVIVADEIIARRGPSEAVFDPVFDQPLRAGTEGVIIETRAGWLRLRLASGAEAWIPAPAAEEL